MNTKIYRIGRVAVLALIPTLLFSSCGKTDNPEANKRDSKGNTVLMKAAMWGNTECVKELLIAGAKINAKNKDGKTALMLAVWRGGNAECVKVLLAAGADVSAKDKDGKTALILANESKYGNTSCVKVLREAEARK